MLQGRKKADQAAALRASFSAKREEKAAKKQADIEALLFRFAEREFCFVLLNARRKLLSSGPILTKL